MSIEKQIEEMAKVMCGKSKPCFLCEVQTPCRCQTDAELLYEAGYRKQEWISVDERLPQVTGKYICCVKDKRGNTWTITADWSFEMKTWFGDFGEINNTITHWMPLPMPPKGDEGK